MTDENPTSPSVRPTQPASPAPHTPPDPSPARHPADQPGAFFHGPLRAIGFWSGLLVLLAIFIALANVPMSRGAWTTLVIIGVAVAMTIAVLPARVGPKLVGALPLVLAVAALLIGVPQIDPAPDPQPSRSGSCASRVGELPILADLAATVNWETAGYALNGVRYRLRGTNQNPRASQLYLSIGGHLTGRLPAGQRAYMLLRADETTFDSLGNRGWPNFYPRDLIQPDRDGCYFIPERRTLYAGGTGLRFRIFVMLLSEAAVSALESRKARTSFAPSARDDGMSEQDVVALGGRPIAYFDVDTKRDHIVIQ